MPRLSIDVSDEIVEKARINCIREGTTLPEFLKSILIEKSKEKIKDAEAVLHESLLVDEVWAPSRATLSSMRNSGELTEGVENDASSGYFYKKGQNIFYYLTKTRAYFKKHYAHIEKANLAKREKAKAQ